MSHVVQVQTQVKDRESDLVERNNHSDFSELFTLISRLVAQRTYREQREKRRMGASTEPMNGAVARTTCAEAAQSRNRRVKKQKSQTNKEPRT